MEDESYITQLILFPLLLPCIKVNIHLVLVIITVSDLDEAGGLGFLNNQWKEKGVGWAPPEHNASFIF